MNTHFNDVIAANVRRAIAAHARPLPAYAASGIDFRFANGNAPDGWHLEDGAEARPGQYRVYARRMSIVPLDQRYGPASRSGPRVSSSCRTTRT